MRSLKTKTIAALLAAVMASAALAGCAGKEDVNKKTSAGSDSAAETSAGAKTGEKKIEIYADDDDNIYYYDKDGKKMMLLAVDYDDQFGDTATDVDLSNFAIYGHYEGSNGLSFDIPDGWFAEDMYETGAPTVYKKDEAEDFNIAIIPASFLLDYDMDKDKKVDEKAVKNYFETLVSCGLYEDYKINDKSAGKLGGKDADVYDITVSFKNDAEGALEKSRTVYYVTKEKNCYIGMVKVSLDSEASAKEYLDVFAKIAESTKLPSEEQTKEMMKKYFDEDASGVVMDEDELGDLGNDDVIPEIEVPGGDGEDKDLPAE